MNETEQNKVPSQINDIPSDNLKLLAQLFPSVVKDGEVDFQALREELGQFQEVDEKERYALTWTGKQEAKKEAQRDTINRTLNYIPEDSKHPETTENLYIEGDNLEVLKLLRQNYYGSVKMIYIDPPYNTGNDFVYKDNFTMSKEENDIAEGNVDEEGNRLQVNSKTSNRYHANWLNMMYPRLKLAKDLLTEDGVIFISIDDSEQANLKKLCDEVYGEQNFVCNIIWHKKYGAANDAKYLSDVHDFILVYCKNKIGWCPNLFPRPEELNAKYKNPDNDPRGPWIATNLSVKTYSTANDYIITSPVGIDFSPPPTRCWGVSRDKYEKMLEDKRITFGKDNTSRPYSKTFLSEVQNGVVPTTIWSYSEAGHNIGAKSQLRELFSSDNTVPFDTPKPTALLQRLFSMGESKNESDLILDFFSGSATTAHAVMQLNAEDGGNRKFICVQIPELTDEKSEAYKAGYKNICEIGKERIRRAGEKIKSEVEEANTQLKMDESPKQVPDIGFKVLRASDTNIKWNLLENLEQQTFDDLSHTPDLADFVSGAKDVDIVYELLLRQRNIPLNFPLEQLGDICSRTYLYGSAFLVCLETEITEEMTDKLAQLDPLPHKFIFRDSSFGEDINKKSLTFRLFHKQIDKYKPKEEEAVYTIDFI